jgi:hypothetical protein
MTRNTLALLAALGTAAAPATASAASTSIVAGPLKVKDYAMTLTATDGGAHDSLGVVFTRRAGQATQTHYYTFAQGVQVTASRIKGSLGRYGAIDLKLAAGPARRGATPKGCTGKAGTVRTGALKGSFKLVADATYFKTVTARSLRAQVVRGGKIDCGGGAPTPGAGGGAGETMLTSTADTPAGMVMLSVIEDAKGAVTQQAMRSDDAAATAPATIMHMIDAPGTSAAFAPAGDLSSATGTGVAPFFGGAFSFASEEPMGSVASGTLSGDIAARFDSIGTQTFGGDAMLMRR